MVIILVQRLKIYRLVGKRNFDFECETDVERFQPQLYPTVGLQTPGEVVDANFGQEPFKFDIEDMMNDLRASTRASIYDFPLPQNQGDWTATLHK